MKFESKIRYKHGVFLEFPLLFARKCSKCGKMFLWEWGWSALTWPFYNGQGRWRSVCKKCVGNRDGAHEFFEKGEWMPPKGRPPPPFPSVPKTKKPEPKPKTMGEGNRAIELE